MAPVVPDPDRILAFPDGAAFEAWLAEHHADWSEVWLRIFKKNSGIPSITHAEALDVALCWGWIDAIRKAGDEASFLQRFTPRKTRSIWSQVNRDHVARLVAAGRMRPPGLRQVEAAQADGRWDAAYAPGRSMTVPEDLLAAIAADPAAQRTFDTLNRQNRFALAFRLGNLKTEAGRRNKIATFVALLARGETLLPNGKGRGGK